MAPLWYVNRSRDLFQVRYASEPILCMAALLVYSLAREALISSLPRLIKHTLVTRGFRGDVVGRLLPLDCLARLRLQAERLNLHRNGSEIEKRASKLNIEPHEREYHQRCGLEQPFTFGDREVEIAFFVTVGKFLQEFAGDPIVRRVDEMQDSELPVPSADRQKLLNGHIFANHWVQLEKKPTRRVLAMMINQGAMALMPPDHSGIDAIIPVLLENNEVDISSRLPFFSQDDLPPGEKAKEEFDTKDWEDRVSFILLQYKNYEPEESDKTWAFSRFNMSSEHAEIEDEEPLTPYLAIYQQFGAKGLANVGNCLLRGQLPSERSFVYSRVNDAVYEGSTKLYNRKHTHKQITIVLSGLNPQTYPNIELDHLFTPDGPFASLLVDSSDLSALHKNSECDGGAVRAAFPGVYPPRADI